MNQWGSQLGLSVLGKLSQLYCSLVWESTVLLSLCTPNRYWRGGRGGGGDVWGGSREVEEDFGGVKEEFGE